jgi:hypothetical protein
MIVVLLSGVGGVIGLVIVYRIRGYIGIPILGIIKRASFGCGYIVYAHNFMMNLRKIATNVSYTIETTIKNHFVQKKGLGKLANSILSGLLFLDHRPVLGEIPPIRGKTEKPPIGGELP